MKSSHELHYEWYISIVKLRTYYFTHNLSLRQTKLCHPQHCSQLTHLVPHLQAVWKQEQSDSLVCTVRNTYLMSALLSRMYADHTCSTNTNVFSTRTFIGVRRSGLRRSCTLCSLVWARFTFSFCVYYIHVYIIHWKCNVMHRTQSITARFILMLNTRVEKWIRFGR